MPPRDYLPISTLDKRRALVSDVSDPAGRQRELMLIKRNTRHTYRCAVGEEQQMIATLRELAAQPDSDIDLFDVALLSHELGRRIAQDYTQQRGDQQPRQPGQPPPSRPDAPPRQDASKRAA